MKRLAIASVPVVVCLAVLIFTGRLRAPAPVAVGRQATVAKILGPGPEPVAGAFAEAWWSYDWRQGSGATARAVAAWTTPALGAQVAGAAGAPAWDAERLAAHEIDRPGRVLVTLEDRAPQAVGFAVSAAVEVDRLGKPPSEVERDAEVRVRIVDHRWLVAEVQG